MRNFDDKNFPENEKRIYLFEMAPGSQRWVDLAGCQFIPEIKFPEFLRRACVVLRALTSLNQSPVLLAEKLYYAIQDCKHSKNNAKIDPDMLSILILYAREFDEDMLEGIDQIVRKMYSKSGKLNLKIKNNYGFLYFHWAAMYMSYAKFAALISDYGNSLEERCPINARNFGVGFQCELLAAAVNAKHPSRVLFPIHIATLFANYDALTLLLEGGEPVDRKAHYCPWKTPLHFAIELQDSRLMIALLARRASVSDIAQLSKRDLTFVSWEAVYGTEDTLRIMLAAQTCVLGPDVLANEESIRQAIDTNAFSEATDPNPLEPVDDRDSFLMAKELSRFGNTGQLRLVLRTMPWLKTARDSCNYNLLNQGIVSQNPSIVNLLLVNGVDAENVTQGGYNPIEQCLFNFQNEPLADVIVYQSPRLQIREASYGYFIRHHNRMVELLWILSRTFLMELPNEVVLRIFEKLLITLTEFQNTKEGAVIVASPDNTFNFFRSCVRTPLTALRPLLLQVLGVYLENDAQLVMVAKASACQALLQRINTLPRLAFASLRDKSVGRALRQLNWAFEDKFIDDLPDILLLAQYYRVAKSSKLDLIAIANDMNKSKQDRCYAAYALSVGYLADNDHHKAQEWRSIALECDNTLVGILHAFGAAHLDDSPASDAITEGFNRKSNK